MSRRQKRREIVAWISVAIGVPAGLVGIWGRFVGRNDILLGGFSIVVVVMLVGMIGPTIDGWRGESYVSRQVRAPASWRFSPGLWRANRRVTSVAAIGAGPGLALLALCGPMLFLEWPAPPDQLRWSIPLLLLTGAYWVTYLALNLSVALLNRPTWAVPPHLRSLPGYLHDDIHDPEVGAEAHRTPRELGLEGNYPRDPDR